MLPCTLLGSLIGVQLNSILPDVVVLGLLTILLFYMAYKALRSAIKKFRQENKEKREERQNNMLAKNEGEEGVEKKEKEVNMVASNSPRQIRPIEEIELAEIKHETKNHAYEHSNPDKSLDKEECELPPINQPKDMTEGPQEEEESEQKQQQSERTEAHSPIDVQEDVMRSDEGSPARDEEEKEKSEKSESSGDSETELQSMAKIDSPALRKIKKTEKTHFQWSKLLVFIVVFIVLESSSILRGSRRAPSLVGIKTCSWIDWSIYAFTVLFIIGMTIYGSIYLKRLYIRKLKSDYEFKKGDVHWTVKKILLMIFIGFIAGLISGGLGLGGGVIYNPLFLELGISPTVASATGMYLVMFGTLTNTILYAMADYLRYDWGLWQAAFTVTGSIIGLKLVNKAIKKTGRVSIIVFLLALVIFGSAIVIPVNSTFGLIKDLDDGKNVFGFKWLCD